MLAQSLAIVTLAASAAALPNEWYVEADAVTCDTATGSESNPFCTIAEALAAAGEGDTVLIGPGLYRENLNITKDVRLVGREGRDVTRIDGGGLGSVVADYVGADVVIEGLTLCHGAAVWGGGIYSCGALTVRNTTVEGNTAFGAVFPFLISGAGGGISHGGCDRPLTLVNCVIADNVAILLGTGGGLAAAQNRRVQVVGCTFRGNDAQFGPAMLVNDTEFRLDSSTIEGHPQSGDEGVVAVYTVGQRIEILRSTFSGNAAPALVTLGPTLASGMTMTQQSTTGSGSATWVHEGTLLAEVENSVIAGNGWTTAAPTGGQDLSQVADVSGGFRSLGHNFIGNIGSSAFLRAPGDQLGISGGVLDPMLEPLGHNGGPSRTAAPRSGSPLIDGGRPSSLPGVDQRGFARIETPDIGALEFGSESGPAIPGCVGTTNSTGERGALAAAGPRGISANAITLSASSLPAGVTTIFLASRTPGFTVQPWGSEGNLCLGGDIGRFVGPQQVLASTAYGTANLAIDLTNVPTPAGAVAVAAGEVWYFQAWHRDPNAASGISNFTAGIQMTFAP